MDEKLKLNSNYRNKKTTEKETTFSKYEKAVDEYKKLLESNIHPNNQTSSYDKNVKYILNKLAVTADELDNENPGQGIFGLIILALRTNLALRDKNIDLQFQIKELRAKIKRLEKR